MVDLIEAENDFSKDKLTLMFKDQNLESEYMLYHHTFVLSFGKVINFEVLLVNLFDLCTAIGCYDDGHYTWDTVLKIFILGFILQVLLFVHYHKAK